MPLLVLTARLSPRLVDPDALDVTRATADEHQAKRGVASPGAPLARGSRHRGVVVAFAGLAHFVAAMRRAAPATLPDEPQAAFAAVLGAWARAERLSGEHFGDGASAIVNVAGLARATILAGRLIVHELRAPVPRVVAETDLHSPPAEPPTLLRGPCIVEVRDPGDESLFPGAFGATCSLGHYVHEGTHYLVGLDHPDGASVARWRPTWSGGEIGAGIVHEDRAGLLDVEADELAAWGGRDAAR